MNGDDLAKIVTVIALFYAAIAVAICAWDFFTYSFQGLL